MTSILKVDELQGNSGSTITVPSGQTLDLSNATVTGLTTGKVLQIVSAEYSAGTSTTSVIPHDTTIPQNTEGLELTTLSITPTSATSILLIEWFSSMAGGSADMACMLALFQDSTADALSAMQWSNLNEHTVNTAILTHYMTSGTTSSTTFKVRMGSQSGSTTAYINQQGSQDTFGSAGKSLFKITEYEA